MAALANVQAKSADVEVWPENWAAWLVYMRVQTQWRYSWSGVTGLDYQAVYPLIDRMGLSPEDWDHMLADLQIIELAARQKLREPST